VRLRPLLQGSDNRPIVPAPDDKGFHTWARSNGGVMTGMKTWPGATVSTTEPTWTVLGLKKGLRVQMPANKLLNCGNALSCGYYCAKGTLLYVLFTSSVCSSRLKVPWLKTFREHYIWRPVISIANPVFCFLCIAHSLHRRSISVYIRDYIPYQVTREPG
jgi:hypothetical protein